MKSLAYYVPGHMIGKFVSYVKENYNQDAKTLDDALLTKYSSEFTYGKISDPEVTKNVEKKVEKVEKTEEEIFDEIARKKLEVDWKDVVELAWMPAVTKDTGDNVYAIEVCSTVGVLKRIVLRDREKSLRFLSYINKFFVKVLNEKHKCMLNSGR
jgi:hypothetical protein